MTSLIEEGLRAVIAQSRNPARKKRVLPRVSKATRGLMPGIDPSDSAALQEMDDLEYVERLKQFK